MHYSSAYIMLEDTHTTSATPVVPAQKNSWPLSSDLRGRLGLDGLWAGRRDGTVIRCGSQNNPAVDDVGDDYEVPCLTMDSVV
jgi:hypothetical protein